MDLVYSPVDPENSDRSGSGLSSGAKSSQSNGTSSGRRKPRAKTFFTWEQNEMATHGFYADHLEIVAARCPNLSPMEARVAALASGLLPTAEIARILGVTEHSVENHRTSIRKKLGLDRKTNLTMHLQQLVINSLRRDHLGGTIPLH
jgi:DNA-binding CsgD family transcriptional regulator